MRIADMPFNVHLFSATKAQVNAFRPVTVLDIYDHTGVNFHPDGLYSIETFGPIGSTIRDTRFGYIDLKTKIFHPEIFSAIRSLRGLYGAICAGKQYAVFNKETKDYDSALPTDENAGTGFHFFIKHFNQLVFKRTSSDIRNQMIDMIEKYRNVAFVSYQLVAPAGLRDVVVEGNRTIEDESNDYFKKIIIVSNTLVHMGDDFESPIFDSARWALQKNVVALNVFIKKMFAGKKGWFAGKIGTRATHHGTRNVLTAMSPAPLVLGSPDAISIRHTHMGFAQALHGALPFVINGLKKGILGQTFGSNDTTVWLTDPKSLKQAQVLLTPDDFDLYASRSGWERLIHRFLIPQLRAKSIYIGGHYLGLIYQDDIQFKVFKSIDELPSWADKKYVRPLTLADLLFVSTIERFNYLGMYGTSTRYPITKEQSIFPTEFKIRTTHRTLSLIPLDDNWEMMDEKYRVYNFPILDGKEEWFNSISPHICRIDGQGADFDGDKDNVPMVFTKEAIEEIKASYGKRAMLVGANQKLTVSANTTVVNLTIANMTGDPVEYGDSDED